MADVFLDNTFVGITKDPVRLVESIIKARQSQKIPQTINVQHHIKTNSVFIESSKGRSLRPLLVVKDGQPVLNDKHLKDIEKKTIGWQELLSQGVIEYLDATEEENTLVALRQEELTPEHTHLEVAPFDIVSVTTSLVPFGNFNQGVRLNQGAKNQKHAIGFYAANFYCRMDMDVNLLHYPQKPMAASVLNDILEFDKHPIGQNVVVAIISAEGYNMEDAIVLNQGSVDRGLARSTYFRPVITEELRYSGGLIDEICVPDKDVKGYKSEHDYRFIEEDGIIFPEAKVEEGDVIIGKTSPPRFLSALDEYNLATSSRRESSMSLKHGEQGIVDFVCLTENEEGNKLVQVRLRDQRIPEIGDKFTSRHGQKGVISRILPEADVPFTTSGIRPDILFTPHGIISRMTVSHLIESLGGKVGALAGKYVDGTLFDSEHHIDLRAELLKLGFRENGTEMMYNGVTGDPFNVTIYIGNMYYLKLKHMVQNRQHSRARGPIQLLTRQPTEGRAKEGGLRLGEMEKDTFIAHGTSLVLKERFDSDKTIVPVCENCGLIAIYDSRNNRSYCTICGENVEINNVEISYAFKLMLDELKSMTVYPKLKLKGKY